MTSTNPVQAAVGRLAAAQRWKQTDTIDEARNDLAAAHLERAILRAVQPQEPGYAPLREEDRQRLAELLLTG
jgi:hypothetical protein